MTNKTQTTAKPLACLPQPTITLVNGGEYITRAGEKVKMSVDEYCHPGLSYHQFFGSNGFYYKTNGMLFNDQEYEADVVSEVPKITLEHGKTYVTTGGERVTVQTKQDSFTPFYKFIGDNNYQYGEHGDFHPVCSSWDAEHVIVSEYKEPTKYTEAEVQQMLAEAYQDGLNAGNTFSTSELQSLTKMQSKVITALEAEILELKETAQYLGNCVGLVNRVNGLRKQIFNEITTKKKRLVKLVALQQRMKRSK